LVLAGERQATLCGFCPVPSAVSFILAVAQNLGLDLKEIGLNGGSTTHAPQQRCKAGHQLALHGSSGVVICDDIRFECLILFVPPRATTTVSAVNPFPLRATTKSERLVHAKPRLVASAQHHLQFSRPSIQLTAQREELTTGRTLEKCLVVGRLRRFAHAIAIAAAITSAAAADLPEISLMNTLLLWDEGGIAFGDLTFRNRPLLGTATAIVVDCQFLDRDGQKVDQRKLTVEEPVYGRTIKTVRVRIGTLSDAAETMACSVVDFKWVSWQH
jgi:hypothetical protein